MDVMTGKTRKNRERVHLTSGRNNNEDDNIHSRSMLIALHSLEKRKVINSPIPCVIRTQPLLATIPVLSEELVGIPSKMTVELEATLQKRLEETTMKKDEQMVRA